MSEIEFDWKKTRGNETSRAARRRRRKTRNKKNGGSEDVARKLDGNAGEREEEVQKVEEKPSDRTPRRRINRQRPIDCAPKIEKGKSEKEEVELKEEEVEELAEELERFGVETDRFLQMKLARLAELKEANRIEKEKNAVVDAIFDVVSTWTEIDFHFCHLVEINKALKTVDARGERRMRASVMKKARMIAELHASVVKKLPEILDSIDELMDFVEMGRSEKYRTGMILALRSLRSCPFWTFASGNFESLKEGFERMEVSVREVRDGFLELSLVQLRPRKSVRQMLQDDIEDMKQEFNFRSVSFM